jgi:ribonucleotide monophosphatase NagD (HAD superfamily)
VLAERYCTQHVLVTGGVGNACREVAETYGFQPVITSTDIITQYPKYWPFNQIGKEYYEPFARPLPAPINSADPGNSLKISAIFVFNSSRTWGMDAQLCLDLLISDRGILGTESPMNGRSGIPNNGWQNGGQPAIHFANPDFVWATNWEHGPRFGQGAWITALEAIFAEHTNYAGILQSHKVGKPHATNFHCGEDVLIRKRNVMCQELGVTAEEAGNLSHVFMIGDNPKSDVEGANNFKSYNNVVWSSILVETGVWKQGQPDGFPDWIVSNIKTAVNGALKIKNLPTMPE